MKLAILSCGPNSYSTRRLKEAALERNYNVKVLNTLKFAIDLDQGHPDLYFSSEATQSLRCSAAPYWRLDHLLRNVRRPAIRGNGCVLCKHG